MATRFPSSNVLFSWMGHPLYAGTLLRNTNTGDVGALQWVSSLGNRPDGSFGSADVPRTAGWDDLYLKVDVWRTGRSRLWRGVDVELVLDPDTGNPPIRLEP